MRRMDWHMAGSLALYAAGIQLVLSQMVLLLHTLVIMRPILGGALPMSVFWDAYLGALPNVFYLTLPLSVAFALIFGYAHFARERTFVALFSAGVSNWRLAAPGLAVAAGAALAGAAVANFWAPLGAQRLEDAKHFVQVELPHRLLPERHFVDIVPARLTVYFKNWAEPDVAAQISLYDRRDDREHRVIDAKLGKFVRQGGSLSIVFQNGTLHTFDRANGAAQAIAFREFAVNYELRADPAAARRPGPLFYEQGTGALIAPSAEVRARGAEFRRSQAELHKRLATPFFVLCYASLIIAAAFFIERTGRRISAFLAVLPLTLCCGHIAFIVLFETGVRAGPGVVFLAYALLAAGVAAGAGIIQMHDSGQAWRLGRGPRAWARWAAAVSFRMRGDRPMRLRSAMLRLDLPVRHAAKHPRDMT
jgi:lipopolysaccharide export system permease protein